MRIAATALLLLTWQTATALQQNILENIPPTAIYVETAYEGNENKVGCDWYTPVTQTIESNYADKDQFGQDCVINIRLRGIINREGAELFARLVERLENSSHRPAAVILNSRGGDADAAINIGRIIRDRALFSALPGGVQTRIAEDNAAVCFSACVVIFSAGYRRAAEFNIDNNPNLPSRLGIHGPGHYDEKAERYDTAESNAQLIRISSALRKFFKSIDVRDEIVDDMFAVPFDEIRLLSETDLAGYGIEISQTGQQLIL
jgi:hypothetical protein